MFGENTQHCERSTESEIRGQSSPEREEEKRGRKIVWLSIGVIIPQLDWRKEHKHCRKEAKTRIDSPPDEATDRKDGTSK